jgi:hypothetical protein
MGFNRFLLLDLTILCLLSSSWFVSLYWWQIQPLVRSPDLLCGVEPMKKSRLMRKGTICELTRVWVAAVFGLLRVGLVEAGCADDGLRATMELAGGGG